MAVEKDMLFDLEQLDKDQNVFSNNRNIECPDINLHESIIPNTRLRMDGIIMLSLIPEESIPVVFFDPQYRGVLDKLKYGNEGKSREKRRSELNQMSIENIKSFITYIDKSLIPSGHLFLWVDKFHLCQGVTGWINETELEIVDLIVWDKQKMGMGYRTRRTIEFCVVIQKKPKRAKGVWKTHNIKDAWQEKVSTKNHPHAKPIHLQSELIESVSNEGDYIVDPAAGSFSVMKAAHLKNRNFIGCDLQV